MNCAKNTDKGPRPILVIQINLHHSKVAMSTLDRMLDECTEAVVLAQEPYLLKGQVSGLAGGIQVHQAPGPKPRAAIFVKNVNLWPCYSLSDADSVTCLGQLGNGSGLVYVNSSYCAGDIMEVPKALEATADKARQDSKGLVVGMDSNAHSRVWGHKDDQRGEMILEFMAKYGLLLQNNDKEITFCSPLGSTVIDLTMTNMVNITNWRVMEKDLGSDHKGISFQIPLSKPKVRRRWAYRKAKWTSFTSDLEQSSEHWTCPVHWSAEIIDNEALALERDINKALRANCNKAYCRNKPKKPWWTDTLAGKHEEYLKTKAKISNLTHQGHRPGSWVLQRAWAQAKQCYREFKYLIRSAKKSSWRDLTESVQDVANMAKFVRNVTRPKDKSLGLIKRSDGSEADSPEEVGDILMDAFFPDSTNVPKEPKQYSNKSYFHYSDLKDHEDANEIFTTSKLDKAIQSMGPYKAPGPDGISPVVLQHMGPKTLRRLLNMFKISYCLGYVPRGWRHANVICLAKPGKVQYDQARSYRPITLASVFLKVQERLVGWYLETGIMRSRPLHHLQFAFRRNTGTEDALSKVIDFIETQLQRNQVVLGLFLDVSGAFDSIFVNSITNAMAKRGFPKSIVKWYTYFLKNRTIESHILGNTIYRKINRGTGQGLILSPLCWNLVMDEMLIAVNDGIGMGIGFADDGGLLIAGPDLGMLMIRMQQKLNKVLEWGQVSGSKLSKEKTEYLVFRKSGTPKWRCRTRHKLKIDGTDLREVESIKYLGVKLTNRLSWNLHIKEKVAKVKKRLMQIKAATGIIWGPRPSLIRWAFLSMCLPILTYGALVWGHTCLSKQLEQSLRSLNRLTAQSMAPMRDKTPTAGLETILELMPIDITIRKEGLKAFLRLQTKNIQTKATNGHLKFWNDTIINEGINVVKEDRIPTQLNWDKPFRQAEEATSPITASVVSIILKGNCQDQVSIGTMVGVFRKGEPNPIYINKLINNTPKGSQVHLEAIQSGIGIPMLKSALRELRAKDPTLFKSNCVDVYACPRFYRISRFMMNQESTANGLKVLKDIQANGFIINILTGTAYSKNFNKRAKLFIKVTKKTSNIGEGCLAATDGVDGFWTIKPPIGTNAKQVNQWAMGLWNSRWQGINQCRQTKIWFRRIKPGVSRHLLTLPRPDLGLRIQFFTGHTWLRRHISILDPYADPTCRLCRKGEESPEHLWYECQGIGPEARKITNQRPSRSIHSWSPMQVDRFLREPIIANLFNQEIE